MKWRVERAGNPGRWLPGWIATRDGYGALLPTWDAAIAFVAGQMTEQP